MSQTSCRFAVLAADVFRRKFAQKTVAILGPFEGQAVDDVSISDSEIAIYNLPLALSSLRIFGHEIKHLQIEYSDLKSSQRKEIHESLAKYCSKSLTSLMLMDWDNGVLNSFKPMESIEKLTLYGESSASKSTKITSILSQKSLGLNEIFPRLKHLELIHTNLDAHVFDVKFSHLEHVMVKFFLMSLSNYYVSNVAAIERLFKANTQIRNLTIENCYSLEYLTVGSKHLPNLETLDVNWVISEEDEISGSVHFDRLNKLMMWWRNVNLSKVITINQLKELFVSCSANDCIQFIMANRNLTKLHLAAQSLTEQDILHIGNNLPLLEELSVATTVAVDKEMLTKQIEAIRHLTKFNLTIVDEKSFDFA